MPEMKIIARIHTPFDTKFGIPRQSGVAADVKGEIVFEPEYREQEAVRGLEGFSHIWLIWCFSESVTDKWSPTVRPPRLGGNVRMGVFATRSPFRPVSYTHLDVYKRQHFVCVKIRSDNGAAALNGVGKGKAAAEHKHAENKRNYFFHVQFVLSRKSIYCSICKLRLC